MTEVVKYTGSELQTIDENIIDKIPQALAGMKTQNTIERYRGDFIQYKAFADERSLDVFDPRTFAAWRTYLVTCDKNYGVRSINRMLSSVRSIMKEWGNIGYIDLSVAAQFRVIGGASLKAAPTRQKEHARTQITKAQMEAICSAPDQSTASGLMHYALLMTLRYTGARVSEVVALKRSQIQQYVNDDDDAEEVTGWVVYLMGKNQTKPIPVELGTKAKEAIDEWVTYRREKLGVDVDYIFTPTGDRFGGGRIVDKPLTVQRAWGIVKQYAAQAGVKHVKPHDFRRYVGTRLAKKDNLLTAQQQLRHKSMTTTAENYVFQSVKIGMIDKHC